MTFFFETSKPFQRKYGKYDSAIIRRYWLAWFSWGWLKISFIEFTTGAFTWEASNK